jgi:hypothetical protein
MLASRNYCKKSDTRVDGPYVFTSPPPKPLPVPSLSTLSEASIYNKCTIDDYSVAQISKLFPLNS